MKKIKQWGVTLCLLTAMLWVGCEQETADSNTIRIAAKDFTEQYILGEMLAILIEERTDLDVELTQGIAGETSIIMPAMERGDFDLYPEYDSTAWMTVLKEPKNHDTEAMHRDLQAIYNEKYDMQWPIWFGFDNTYGIAVRRDTAEKYDLKTYSDLAEVSDELVFGAGYEFFEREDGYTDLQKLYGFAFKDIKEMNLSLKYNALSDGEVDAITIYKTDGRMEHPDFIELKDDKNYFPPAMGGIILRNEVAAAHPEVTEVLALLHNAINNDDMRKMNAAVDMEGEEPRDVAAAFLRQKELIP